MIKVGWLGVSAGAKDSGSLEVTDEGGAQCVTEIRVIKLQKGVRKNCHPSGLKKNTLQQTFLEALLSLNL